MADSPEAIHKAKKNYIIVFLILMCMTVATVAVATIPALDIGKHGFDTADMILGLLIASFKAGCVMFIFMHLNHEKKLIYFLFGLAIVLALCLYFITKLAFIDPIIFEGFRLGEPK